MVLAPKDFRDEEYKEPREVFEDAGFDIALASSRVGDAIGVLGTRVSVNQTISSINIHNYDALVIVGGHGMIEMWHNDDLIMVVQDAVRENKIIGAICSAPVVLANAGVLQGKKATVFAESNSRLSEKGAQYTGEPVTRDGNIITADGPESAHDFGIKIEEALNESV